MRRRDCRDRGIRRTTLALLTLLLGVGCAGNPQGSRDPLPAPRNVIFVVIDALRADHMGTFGYERDTTPNLDRFAGKNVLFTRAYSAASWTLPSLASFMTSVHPEVHGVRRPPDNPDHVALSERFLTLAESLRSHGFHTASIT